MTPVSPQSIAVLTETVGSYIGEIRDLKHTKNKYFKIHSDKILQCGLVNLSKSKVTLCKIVDPDNEMGFSAQKVKNAPNLDELKTKS